MADREKVIEHITDCVNIADRQTNHNWVFVRTEILHDALALLKAQEPGMVNVTITQSDGWKEGNCPFCGMKVDSFYNWSFCGTCGKGLKWE